MSHANAERSLLGILATVVFALAIAVLLVVGFAHDSASYGIRASPEVTQSALPDSSSAVNVTHDTDVSPAAAIQNAMVIPDSSSEGSVAAGLTTSLAASSGSNVFSTVSTTVPDVSQGGTLSSSVTPCNAVDDCIPRANMSALSGSRIDFEKATTINGIVAMMSSVHSPTTNDVSLVSSTTGTRDSPDAVTPQTPVSLYDTRSVSIGDAVIPLARFVSEAQLANIILATAILGIALTYGLYRRQHRNGGVFISHRLAGTVSS